MDGFLILASVLAFGVNALVTRAFQLKFPGERGKLRLYQSLFSLTAAIAFALSLVLSESGGMIGLAEVIYGVLFGVFYFTAVLGSSTGYELGSMALTAIIMNMSLFIPLLYSVILLGEPLTGLRIVGILLIAATMVLASTGGKGGTSRLWLVVVLGGFLSNGLTAVIQKRYVLAEGDLLTSGFMSVAYLTAAILFFGDSLRSAKKEEKKLTEKIPLIIVASAISGLGSFGGNGLLGYLCTRVDGAILYPCLNGGLCVLSALMSFSLFKEKPTLRRISAIVVGIGAIVTLSL